MSINIKKYTKEQMAKMVEDAAERLKSQKKENEELAEQLKSQTAKTIALRNDLMEKMHSNAVLTEKLDQMNGEAITRENVIANLKADADALRNKLADTEAALGRVNACIATMQVERDQQTKDCFEWQRSAKDLHDDLLNARERAHYAEAHPWRNLWAWVKRKLGGERNEHVS
jgi:SMC interacting uncharacterized protein involved in chromosome segregation